MAKHLIICTFLALIFVQLTVFTFAVPTEETKTDLFDGIENSKIVYKSNEDGDVSKMLLNVEQREVAEEKDDDDDSDDEPVSVDEGGRFEKKTSERNVAEEKEDSVNKDVKVVPVKETKELKTGLIYSSKTSDNEQTLDKTLKRFSTSIKNEVLADIFHAKSDNPNFLSTSSRYACFSFLVFYRGYTQRFRVRSLLWHVRYSTIRGNCFRKVTYSGRIITVRPFCYARIWYFRA